MDPVLSAIAAALVSALLVYGFTRRAANTADLQLREQEQATRELEKRIHQRESEFLAARNTAEIQHADRLREAREQSFEQGRQQGLAERMAEHANAMERQRLELMATVDEECRRAVVSAREEMRSTFELQSKLFTVRISPYLKVTDNSGPWRKEHETVAGYQYQLLINGIPAFQPHVIVEQTQVKKEFDEKVKQALIDTAQGAANAAIDLYLGGAATQFVKRGPLVLDRAGKKLTQ